MKYALTITAMTLAELRSAAFEFVEDTDNDGDGATVTLDAGAVDSLGVPWSEEWHAKNKGKNADQTWRLKKGIDRDAYAAWVASVKSANSQAPVQQQPMNTGMTQPVQQMQPIQQMQPVQQMQPIQQMQPVQQSPMNTGMMQAGAIPNAQPMQQVMQQPVQSTAVDFNGFLFKIGPMMQSGQLPNHVLNEVLTSVGLAGGLDQLSANQQMLHSVINALALRGLWS